MFRVGLRGCFSNPANPLKSLISHVIKGSRRPQRRGEAARITDQRGPVRDNSRQTQTRLSASNRADLLAGYADGVPVRELATRFGVHRGTVREVARRAGIAARQPELPTRKRAQAARLYEGGLTLAQVAEQLGISDAGVLVSGPATAVYHDDAGESFDTTIGLPVSAMPDSALGLDVAELPGGSVLRVAHAGRYETLGEAYRELEAALAHRGLHRTLSWERYLVGPADDPDPERWITEVVVPLPE